MRYLFLIAIAIAACTCGPKPISPKVEIGGKGCREFDKDGCK